MRNGIYEFFTIFSPTGTQLLNNHSVNLTLEKKQGGKLCRASKIEIGVYAGILSWW